MHLIRRLLAALLLAAPGLAWSASETLVIGAVPSLGPAVEVLQKRFVESHPELSIKVRIAPGASLANIGGDAADTPAVLLLDSRTQAAELAVGDSLTALGDGLIAIYTNTPGINTGRGAPLFIADYITGIAVADPATSPFGAITRSALERLTLLETAEKKFKLFADDAAAAAAVKAGHVDIGLIPVPLLVSAGYRKVGSSTALPLGFYTPATYTAAITARGQNSAAARHFIAFLRADSTRALLIEVGIPPASAP